MKLNQHSFLLGLFPLFLSSMGCSSDEGNDLEGLSNNKKPIVGGKFAGGNKDEAEELVANGSIVKIIVPGRVCSGSMLANGWIFTAKHCLVTNATPPKLKANFFKINEKPTNGTVFLADSNDPLAPKNPGPKDIWAAYIHPNRDLALVHSIVPGPHEPDGKMILQKGPMFNPKPIKFGQNVVPVYGFGCNGILDSPKDPLEASMVATGSLQQFVNEGYKTWGIRLNKKDSSGVTASGDSGGPGFISIKTNVKGKDEFINALSTITHGVPTKPGGFSCNYGDHGFFTTFDGKAGYGPFVEQWIGEIQAKPLPQPPPSPTPPPNPNPKQSNINVPGIPFPFPGSPDLYFPTVAWADLDNDGLWDMYSWGEAGLQAAKQVADGLQPPVSLASPFQVVEDNKPFFANFDGEGADDLFALSSNAGQLFLQVLPGHSGGSFANADFFDPSQASFALPAVDVPLSARTASLRNDSGGRRALLLATGTKDLPATINVLFAELSDLQTLGPKIPAVPIPAAIPNLVTGGAANYIVADADSDGLDELIVLAEGESEFSADVSVYYPRTDKGFTYVQPYEIPGIPTNCPVPRNSVSFKDINQDGINDFVCVRPGTIEVRMGVKSSSGTFDGVFEEAIQSDFSWFQSSDPSAATDNDGYLLKNPGRCESWAAVGLTDWRTQATTSGISPPAPWTSLTSTSPASLTTSSAPSSPPC